MFILILLIAEFCIVSPSNDTLNGNWKPIRFEAGGYETGDVGNEQELIIVDDQFAFIRTTGTESGTFTVEENRIVFHVKEGPFAGKHRKALYQLKNNKLFLTIATKDEYPKKMSTAADHTNIKFTYVKTK
jgi:uncharacterized protein (TIGR03067 family)